MDRKIQDYLHLYIGCEVHSPQGPSRLCSVGILGNDGQKYRKLIGGMSTTDEFRSPADKLILRQLSDMTEEECKFLTGYNKFKEIRELIKFKKENNLAILEYRWKDSRIGNIDGYAYSSSAIYFNKKEWTPEQFQYLLSNGFDLFNLIPDNLAINKTTLSL